MSCLEHSQLSSALVRCEEGTEHPAVGWGLHSTARPCFTKASEEVRRQLWKGGSTQSLGTNLSQGTLFQDCLWASRPHCIQVSMSSGSQILHPHWGQGSISGQWAWRTTDVGWCCEIEKHPGAEYWNPKPDVLWHRYWFPCRVTSKPCSQGWARICGCQWISGDHYMWRNPRCSGLPSLSNWKPRFFAAISPDEAWKHS